MAVFWALLYCMTFGQVTVGDEAPDIAQATRAIVERLETGSKADRDQAEAELVELGPTVLEHLPVVTDATSEALRSRLLRVRSELEKRAAKQEAVASRVTLEGQMKLSAALAEIRKQTGNRIVDNRDNYGQSANDPAIETDLKDVTFWEALDTVLARAGMALDPYVLESSATGFVALAEYQEPAAGRVAHAGRFRFDPMRTEAYRNLRNPNDQFLRLGLEIAWEPQTTPVALTYLPDTMSAVDENDNPLTLTGPDEAIEIPVHETGSAVEIDIPFALPEKKAQSIAKLSGRFEALVPGQNATFEFTKLGGDKVQTKSAGGVTVVLRRVREAQNLTDVWILVRIQDADESLQSHRGWVYNNPASLVAPDGTVHEYVGMDTFRQEDAEFGISYKFDLTGDLSEYKFIYSTPAAILSVPVEFELTDIRLP
jgi:hypothetical protein